mmetsp:Transcript_28931/g.64692  ORF Transcript_28931/g.64692 Transcript_28931/m.64692 type:complete len:154 (+) Transcript_28931:59-520(+)|eukprot:CAMPEP_0172583418 /NCGR_PEP_ID=MMETSP1068-20121228/3052_1 /TAXON_ID=35684 /ORGANISM="Pseudopedinella elastica, Strain CCMP716" /LENGTH=153 /DNA_ID=CAMNT_0013377203 /DNA_START=56 /DNA_END=517 /DNA_ORIENTATION=-
MNKSFRGAMQHYLQVQPELTHSQTVMRLYRASLRCLASWAVDREVFNEEGLRIQGLFRANQGASMGAAKRLVREANEHLFSLTHPDKYIPAYMPGGSLFMRNPPLPLSVCYPGGLPAGVEPLKELNPDMTYLVAGEKAAAGRVLVDSAGKTMY